MRQKRQRPSLAVYIAVAAAVVALIAAACSRGRQYELRGQILAVDQSRQEVTIKHEDIKGFMPGMTMPFKVSSASLLDGRTPGDLVRATLVVNDSQGVLTAIEQTGHAPLTERPPARPAADALKPGNAVPDVELVDESGATRRLSDWRGRAVALTFIYTRCPLPDFCPLMDRQFADVQQIVADDTTLRGRVQLLSISFDPGVRHVRCSGHAREKGRRRSRHLELSDRQPARHRHLCCALRCVHHARRSDPGSVVHNLRTAVVDTNGKLVTIINGMQWAPSELVTGLRSAVGDR